jgi:S-adenosylmethionine:tRNA ribosyltransferase-isomerase
MNVDLFDFDLPPERIALRPAAPRDAARMLVVDGSGLHDRIVRDLPGQLRAGDCLVFNDTRVIPAQLEGTRERLEDGAQSAPGAKIGATLHKREGPRRWRPSSATPSACAKARRWISARGHCPRFESAPRMAASRSISRATSRSSCCWNAAAACRCRPISPPSARPTPATRRLPDDVCKREDGAVAAPTAALHFTPELIAALEAAGIGPTPR